MPRIEGGEVAGYENIKDKGFDHRSTGELRKIQSKGGINSGKTRRRKADFRKTLNMLLTSEINSEEWKPILEALGIKCTLESALNMAMIREGLAGNVKAYEAIAKYSGQGTGTDADLEEQRIRTDRAKRARDQEVGDTDASNENIKSFLNAINPSAEDLQKLFAEEGEGDNNAEEAEKAGQV